MSLPEESGQAAHDCQPVPGQLGRLLFVGLNPPLTSGSRTRNRVELARVLLGFASVEHGNLFAHATRDLAEIGTVGVAEDGWLAARVQLIAQSQSADGVLLGYGVQAPKGAAGDQFRAQVAWLESHLEQVRMPIWQVGGLPRHPSRWQRYTYRTHSGVAFEKALAAVLLKRESFV